MRSPQKVNHSDNPCDSVLKAFVDCKLPSLSLKCACLIFNQRPDFASNDLHELSLSSGCVSPISATVWTQNDSKKIELPIQIQYKHYINEWSIL